MFPHLSVMAQIPFAVPQVHLGNAVPGIVFNGHRMYGSRRYYFNYYSKFFVVLQGDFFIQWNRIITCIVQSALCQENPLTQGVLHFPGSCIRQVTGHIQLVLRIPVRCIEACGGQVFSHAGPVCIGKPGFILSVANLSHPSAQIALIDAVIIVHRLHACVYNIMDTDIAVKVGYIKVSLVPEILSPAVGADKGAVPGQVHIKILPGIIVVPSHNDRIVVRLLASNVTIGIGFPVIVHGLALIIPHGCIQRTLDSPSQVHSPFNGLVIFGRQDLNLLYMDTGRKTVRRNSVPIWVLGFQHRALPGQQIGHGHGVLTALVLSQKKTVVHGHMVHCKGHGFSRKQGGLQGCQGSKCPAGSQGPLVSNLGRPSCLPVVIGRRKLHIYHIPSVPPVLAARTAAWCRCAALSRGIGTSICFPWACFKTACPGGGPDSVRVLGPAGILHPARVLGPIRVFKSLHVLCLSRIHRMAASGRPQRRHNSQKQDGCPFSYSIPYYICCNNHWQPSQFVPFSWLRLGGFGPMN